MLFSTASFIILLLISGVASSSGGMTLPDGFMTEVLQNSYGLSNLVSVDNSTNNSAIVNQLYNTTQSGFNQTNSTDVASIFGVDFNTLTSSTGLLNIFAAARKFFVTIFSFFVAPMLLLSLFRLPLIIVIIFDGIYVTWWGAAIYEMFRG